MDNIANRNFGLDVPKVTEFTKLLDTCEPLNSIDAQIYSQEAYDITYDIFNHDDDSVWTPLSSVNLHPKEDFITNSPLLKTITRYKNLHIQKYFGIDLMTFLNQPRYICEHLLSLASKDEQEEAKIAEELKNKAEQAKKK